MNVSLNAYLILSAALLAMGVYGLLARRNVVAMLISLELVLSAANLNFVALDRFVFAAKGGGITFALFVIALAAAEACVALSIALALFRRNRSILIDDAKELKG